MDWIELLRKQMLENAATSIDKLVIEELEKSMPPPVPQSPRRWLVWRGKRYEEAVCCDCGKLRAVVEVSGKDLEGDWSSGKMCYKCHYRETELSERVASELRSACAGGTWTEPEAKPLKGGQRMLTLHKFTLKVGEYVCACGMRMTTKMDPITPESAGLDSCPTVEVAKP